MNWYSFIKCAQVWETGDPDSFLGNIARLYELEYKYSMLTTRPFNGVPQRKENIINRLSENVDKIIEGEIEYVPEYQSFETNEEREAYVNYLYLKGEGLKSDLQRKS